MYRVSYNAASHDTCSKFMESSSYVESSCTVHNVEFGTGESIFHTSILPAIEAAQIEVIFVTCFWAESKTRISLSQSLRSLSGRAQQEQTKIRVRICFSSTSILQKLFHTSSPNGRAYSETEWEKHLGIPSVSELKGLDLEVKSVFFRPFSVMHSKFVIIDREHVFLPSCNVSWENWFEGCIHLSGTVVSQFVGFWQDFWSSDWDKKADREEHLQGSGFLQLRKRRDERGTVTENVLNTGISITRCAFLPSPHSINPHFPSPWKRHPPAPHTPLNLFLLNIFTEARSTIFMQTPNITSPPVMDALLSALARGVSVNLITSEKLMTLEQRITAGTTSSRCVKYIVRQYHTLRNKHSDEEEGLRNLGKLQISYYHLRSPIGTVKGEPNQSHVKLTIIDNRIVVFGSGNMDRASWYTSQELDVAFFSEELAVVVQEKLRAKLEGRIGEVFSGNEHTKPPGNILERLVTAFRQAIYCW